MDEFRELAWNKPATPMHLQDSHNLPAMTSWFTSNKRKKGSATVSFSDKLEPFGSLQMPYEFMTSGDDFDPSLGSSLTCLEGFREWLAGGPSLDSEEAPEETRFLCELVDQLLECERGKSRFLQFDAPLDLILQASLYNKSRNGPSGRISQLYIAQCEIRSLPPELKEDLPTPDLVGQVGKKDIYSTSIWLGLQPTYTPLHRDPNPNLFCQLVGTKMVRIMEPDAGLAIFRQVRESLGVPSNSRVRGAEMMDGPERDALHQAVWVSPDPSGTIFQCVMNPGDALFIPEHWWHSVRSFGEATELNASANWWFR